MNPPTSVSLPVDPLITTSAAPGAPAGVSHVMVVAEAWEPGNGTLTPTLKIRRHIIEERYRSLLQRQHATSIVFEADLDSPRRR